MAARTGIAILVITHMNKRSDTRKAMQMVAGSHVLIAAVRGTLVTAQDPNNLDRRLILPIKPKIAKDEGGFAFSVTGAPHSVCGDVPRVVWESQRVTDIDADEALIDFTPRAQAAIEKSNEVQGWLRNLLRLEPKPAGDIWRIAKEKNLSERRVRNAFKSLGITCEVTGFQGKWHYRPPLVSVTKGTHE